MSGPDELFDDPFALDEDDTIPNGQLLDEVEVSVDRDEDGALRAVVILERVDGKQIETHCTAAALRELVGQLEDAEQRMARAASKARR